MIKEVVFRHTNVDYLYRLHTAKLNKIVNFMQLKSYLNNIKENCPNNFFESGPRSSMLKFKLGIRLHCIKGHEVSDLTKKAIKLNGKSHQSIQSFMLENDDKTIACEIPIWLNNNEISSFKRLFNSNLPLTGHIDLLRIEDNKIWVWDYKPKATEQLYASTQVYFYALMLSKRTSIPLNNFRCGYFDKDYAFLFMPEESAITTNKTLNDF
ncbi:MAG: PD-(D/E)XK nuclease family protein [Nanoarchaeota archaeon]